MINFLQIIQQALGHKNGQDTRDFTLRACSLWSAVIVLSKHALKQHISALPSNTKASPHKMPPLLCSSVVSLAPDLLLLQLKGCVLLTHLLEEMLRPSICGMSIRENAQCIVWTGCQGNHEKDHIIMSQKKKRTLLTKKADSRVTQINRNKRFQALWAQTMGRYYIFCGP